jgi:hypothetical protein
VYTWIGGLRRWLRDGTLKEELSRRGDSYPRTETDLCGPDGVNGQKHEVRADTISTRRTFGFILSAVES